MTITTIERSDNFKKSYKKLPLLIRKKFEKQILRLVENMSYPSLKVKKLAGESDIWEARIDRSYRFTFSISEGILRLLMVGMHDTGLGKK